MSGKNTIWLYGRHAVKAALDNKNRKIRRFIATQNAASDFGSLPQKIRVEIVDAKSFDIILGKDVVHQGVAIEVDPLQKLDIEDYLEIEKKHDVLMVLDQITDPHNVGAILRSAAAFNFGAVIMTKDNSPPETTALAKSASGALEIVPVIHVTNLAETLKTLKKNGYWCIGLDGNAKEKIDTALKFEKAAIVMGAEDKGLRRLTRETCDVLVSLPISNKMESLNVSNAAAIAMYLFYDKRKL